MANKADWAVTASSASDPSKLPLVTDGVVAVQNQYFTTDPTLNGQDHWILIDLSIAKQTVVTEVSCPLLLKKCAKELLPRFQVRVWRQIFTADSAALMEGVFVLVSTSATQADWSDTAKATKCGDTLTEPMIGTYHRFRLRKF